MNRARLERVYDTPEQIIQDRPKKPVRGRAARLARYREQNQQAATEEAPTPRKPAVEVYVERTPEPAPAEPGPIVWAYEQIPYSWEQVQRSK